MEAAVRSTELRRDAEGRVRHGSEWLLLWADPDSLRSPEARARALAAARETAAAERALAAALRAMARHPEVEIAFGPAEPALEGSRARLPALPQPASAAALAAVRGAADAIAARLRHHDPALHDAAAPPGVARRLFDAIEQARCEALAARHMPGVLGNLAAATEARLERFGFAHARLAADLPIEEAMAVVLRGALSGTATEFPNLALQVWDRWVRARLPRETATLAETLEDQARFAPAAREFAAALLRSIGRADTPEPTATAHRQAQPTDDAAATIAPRQTVPAAAEEGADERDAEPPPAAGLRPAAAAPAYRAFTTEYDRVVTPAELCDGAELARLRARLEAETGAVRSLLARLAGRLQRRLLARQRRAWDFDLEEGLLDTGKLDRVVVAPGAPLSFKQEREAAFRDTVVALLIDCSGSMRGRPILLAAIAADVTARALERCGVACEVLGYTTADFAGGQSTAAWARAGSPPAPGRLGDLRHIVIKSADAGYRAARAGFGLLLKPDLLRENVDGEALAWAQQRLRARRERRRVLVVISDGAPSETQTLRANPAGLLERHLAATIAAIETEGAVELRAIGIRHDVARHYRRAVTISDAQMVGPALIGQLGAVFDAGLGTRREERRGR
jgi:cobaltochelatase CobT